MLMKQKVMKNGQWSLYILIHCILTNHLEGNHKPYFYRPGYICLYFSGWDHLQVVHWLSGHCISPWQQVKASSLACPENCWTGYWSWSNKNKHFLSTNIHFLSTKIFTSCQVSWLLGDNKFVHIILSFFIQKFW